MRNDKSQQIGEDWSPAAHETAREDLANFVTVIQSYSYPRADGQLIERVLSRLWRIAVDSEDPTEALGLKAPAKKPLKDGHDESAKLGALYRLMRLYKWKPEAAYAAISKGINKTETTVKTAQSESSALKGRSEDDLLHICRSLVEKMKSRGIDIEPKKPKKKKKLRDFL